MAGLAFLAAVAISNLPEAMAATTGLRRIGWTTGRVLGLWGLVVIVSAAAAAAGYGLLSSASVGVVATIVAFAAGAVLTMLADTMIPEAFEEAGAAVGLVTVFGYGIGALLTLVSRRRVRRSPDRGQPPTGPMVQRAGIHVN